MNLAIPYFTQLIITSIICMLLLAYFRPFLKRILVDICGTEDRASFWMAFANILILGIPILYGVGYIPYSYSIENIFFEVVLQIRANLSFFILTIIGVGMAVCLFALTTPRPQVVSKKETI